MLLPWSKDFTGCTLGKCPWIQPKRKQCALQLGYYTGQQERGCQTDIHAVKADNADSCQEQSCRHLAFGRDAMQAKQIKVSKAMLVHVD